MSRNRAGDAHLSVTRVSKSFGPESQVLADISLEVDRGCTVALLGPSGCGKTTLLRMIAGLDVPDSGEIRLGGRTLSGPGVFVPPESRRIGMVFQDWALFPHLSVGRNVGFGLPRGERTSSPRIGEVLELVSLKGMEDRSPATLSGGQQQRVALARALAPGPEVLLLDEPFSNLDASLRSQIRGEVHRLLTELGGTTVFVTHDQEEAFVLGDSVAVMNEGTVIQIGTPSEIYRTPASRWVAEFVGDANFVPGTVSGHMVDTRLGRFAVGGHLRGDVEVLVRPEQLAVNPVGTPGSTTGGNAVEGESFGGSGTADGPRCLGTVSLVEYLGHSVRCTVNCDGLTLVTRSGPTLSVERGQSVQVTCEPDGPLVAFASS